MSDAELAALWKQQDELQAKIMAAEARVRESQSPARSEGLHRGGVGSYMLGSRVAEDEVEVREAGFDPSPLRARGSDVGSPARSVVSDFTGKVICTATSPGMSTAASSVHRSSRGAPPATLGLTDVLGPNERRPMQSRSGLWDKGETPKSSPVRMARPSMYTERPVPPAFR